MGAIRGISRSSAETDFAASGVGWRILLHLSGVVLECGPEIEFREIDCLGEGEQHRRGEV